MMVELTCKEKKKQFISQGINRIQVKITLKSERGRNGVNRFRPNFFFSTTQTR